MVGDSQASFSVSVMNKIRETYEYRCVIFWIDTTECVHILDKAEEGKFQLLNAVRLGVLREGFERTADINAIVQLHHKSCCAITAHPRPQVPRKIRQAHSHCISYSGGKALKPLYEMCLT